jgi:hypothetical protein
MNCADFSPANPRNSAPQVKEKRDFLKASHFLNSERESRLEFKAAIVRGFGKSTKASAAGGLVRAAVERLPQLKIADLVLDPATHPARYRFSRTGLSPVGLYRKVSIRSPESPFPKLCLAR